MVERGKSGEKILGLFYENPLGSYHIREIARKTKISPSTVLKVVNSLVKEGYLLMKKTRPITQVSADLESNLFIRGKKEYNLRNINNSGILDFLIERYNNPVAIVLFGSYSHGENIEQGDIDIAVITEKNLSLDLSKFEKILNRGIHITEVNIKRASKEFLNNLANGTVLYGYLNLL